jgi:hypothetical protein
MTLNDRGWKGEPIKLYYIGSILHDFRQLLQNYIKENLWQESIIWQMWWVGKWVANKTSDEWNVDYSVAWELWLASIMKVLPSVVFAQKWFGTFPRKKFFNMNTLTNLCFFSLEDGCVQD